MLRLSLDVVEEALVVVQVLGVLSAPSEMLGEHDDELLPGELESLLLCCAMALAAAAAAAAVCRREYFRPALAAARSSAGLLPVLAKAEACVLMCLLK